MKKNVFINYMLGILGVMMVSGCRYDAPGMRRNVIQPPVNTQISAVTNSNKCLPLGYERINCSNAAKRMQASPTRLVGRFSSNHYVNPSINQYVTQPQVSQYVTQPQVSQYVTQPQVSQYVTQPQVSQYVSQPQVSQYVNPSINQYASSSMNQPMNPSNMYLIQVGVGLNQ